MKQDDEFTVGKITINTDKMVDDFMKTIRKIADKEIEEYYSVENANKRAEYELNRMKNKNKILPNCGQESYMEYFYPQYKLANSVTNDDFSSYCYDWDSVAPKRFEEPIHLTIPWTNINFTNVEDEIERAIFLDPITIICWKDGTETISKIHSTDEYDKEVGLMLCIAKKQINKSGIRNLVKKYSQE